MYSPCKFDQCIIYLVKYSIVIIVTLYFILFTLIFKWRGLYFIRENQSLYLSNGYKLKSFKCIIISVPLHVDKKHMVKKKRFNLTLEYFSKEQSSCHNFATDRNNLNKLFLITF